MRLSINIILIIKFFIILRNLFIWLYIISCTIIISRSQITKESVNNFLSWDILLNVEYINQALIYLICSIYKYNINVIFYIYIRAHAHKYKQKII